MKERSFTSHFPLLACWTVNRRQHYVKLSNSSGTYHIVGGAQANKFGLLDQAPKMGRTLFLPLAS